MHKHTDICICIDLYTYICIYTSTATTNLHRQTGALQVFVVAEEGAHALEPNLCRRTHVCAEKSDSDPRCRPAAGSWRVSEGQRAHAAALPRCSPRHRFAPRPGTWRPRTPGSVPCPRRAKKSVATPGVAPPPGCVQAPCRLGTARNLVPRNLVDPGSGSVGVHCAPPAAGQVDGGEICPRHARQHGEHVRPRHARFIASARREASTPASAG